MVVRPEPWRLSSAVAFKIARAAVGEVVHKDMFQITEKQGQSTIFTRVDSPTLHYRVRLTDIKGGIVECPEVMLHTITVWKEKEE